MTEPRMNLQLNLAIHLDSGLMIASGVSGRAVHKAVTRDGMGRLVVPASSLKGRLRYHLGRLEALLPRTAPRAVSVEETLLGSRASDNGVGVPGCLYFDDAHTARDASGTHPREPVEVRAGIQLSRRTGSVAKGHLHFFEAASPGLVFYTAIEGDLPGGRQGDALGLLLGALDRVDKLGGGKSRGLGSVRLRVTSLKLNGRLEDAARLRTDYVRMCIKEAGA